MTATLVRERPRVRISPAAPFSSHDYKVLGGRGSCRVVAERRKNAQPYVASFWQDDSLPDEGEYLYRYFDDSGVLLYIGVTHQMEARDNAHWCKPWRPLARLLCIEAFPDRVTSEIAERLAILTEEPAFNVLRRTEDGARMWRYQEYVDACDGCLRGYQWWAFLLPYGPVRPL